MSHKAFLHHSILLVLVAGSVLAARVGGRTLAADTPTANGFSSNDDLLDIDILPRILQDATPVDTPEPGIVSTPGAYGSAASPAPALPAGTTAERTDNSTASAVLPSDTTSGNVSDAASGTVAGTSSDTTRAAPPSDTTSGTTSTTPEDTNSDTIYVSKGTSSREAATMQPQTSSNSQDKAVAGGGSNSSGGDQGAQQLSGNQIAGIAVGVAVAAGAVALGAMAFQRYRRHKVDDYVSRYQRYDGIELQ